MNRYRVTLKSGKVFEAENKWLDIYTIFSGLNNREPFIQIGDTVFAKDDIAVVQKIEEEKLETEEKEIF